MASSHSYNTGLHRHRNHGLAPSPNITIYNTTPAHDTSHEIRDAELAETEMLRVIESQEWRYWTSIERHRVPSTNWIVIHQIIVAISKATDDLRAWIRLYGLAGGAAVMIFGKKSVWEVETKVLGDPGAAPALEFKKIIEDESGRIGISVCSLHLKISYQLVTRDIGCDYHSSGFHWTQSAEYGSNSLDCPCCVHI